MSLGPERAVIRRKLNPHLSTLTSLYSISSYTMIKSQLQDGVLVLQICNPPVNALNNPNEFMTYLNQAEKDDRVIGIVITGSKGFFSAGADINMFKFDPLIDKIHDFPDMITRIDSFPKPIIAAINGVCFGGGLEIALACHLRIATDSAVFAYPEVGLGILPGWGGCQQLARVSSIDLSIEVCVFGKVIDAKSAVKNGMISTIVSFDILMPLALNIFKNLHKYQFCRTSLREIHKTPETEIVFKKALDRCNRIFPNQISPVKCLDLLYKSLNLSFFDSLTLTTEYLIELLLHPQSAALQYSFFNKRRVMKWRIPGGSNYSMVSQVNTFSLIVVIGIGVMGSTIAILFLLKGYKVIVFEINQSRLIAGVKVIEQECKKFGVDTNNLSYSIDLADLKNVDLVIEAVSEVLEIKQEIFRELSLICEKTSVFTSTTSSIDIDLIFKNVQHPNRAIGMHFFNPAHVNPLVECIPSKTTDVNTIGSCMNLCKSLGCLGIVVANVPGFLANRMLSTYLQAAVDVFMEVGQFGIIDAAVKKFGYRIGPFETMDLIGFDTMQYVTKIIKNGKQSKHSDIINSLMEKVIHSGWLGRKSGKGFYIYSKYPKQVNTEIQSYASGTRDNISETELVERCIFPLINEGVNLLKQGIAYHQYDIDVAFVNGFGWPSWRGGPLYYAKEEIGWNQFLTKMNQYYKRYPIDIWKPSELLFDFERDPNKGMQLVKNTSKL